MVRVFRIVAPDGDTEYWATNDLEMGELARLKYAEMAWGIEVYHRALKQECGVERAKVRAARAQRNHIGCAIRAFVRLEWHRLRTGIGWKSSERGDHPPCDPLLSVPSLVYPPRICVSPNSYSRYNDALDECEAGLLEGIDADR